MVLQNGHSLADRPPGRYPALRASRALLRAIERRSATLSYKGSLKRVSTAKANNFKNFLDVEFRGVILECSNSFSFKVCVYPADLDITAMCSKVRFSKLRNCANRDDVDGVWLSRFLHVVSVKSCLVHDGNWFSISLLLSVCIC